jgi:hypothetical protein
MFRRALFDRRHPRQRAGAGALAAAATRSAATRSAATPILVQSLIGPAPHREIVFGYARWRRECAVVREAYAGWRDAAAHQTPLAFAAYRAALDREQRAGDFYALLRSRTAGLNSAGLSSRLPRSSAAESG